MPETVQIWDEKAQTLRTLGQRLVSPREGSAAVIELYELDTLEGKQTTFDIALKETLTLYENFVAAGGEVAEYAYRTKVNGVWLVVKAFGFPVEDK